VVLVVDFGRAQQVKSAKFIECFDVLLDSGRNAVLRQQLADGAVLSF